MRRQPSAKATVLLNNAQGLVPLQNLDQAKVASVHFGLPYAANCDSLLNKYAKVETFNGADYARANNMAGLADALKFFNTGGGGANR